MSTDEIFIAVRALLADRLALKEDQITLESRLIDDLGADSLDFVDIIFGLERTFTIKMRKGELDFISRLDFSSPQVMRQGYVTQETVEQLKPWLPDLDRLPDPAKVTPSAIFSCITVKTLCTLVQRRILEMKIEN
jgi:acyl carrier protein